MTRLICLCNKVSENDVRKLFKKAPLATLSDVVQATGASASCGRCKGELIALLEGYKKQSAGNPDQNPQLTIPFD